MDIVGERSKNELAVGERQSHAIDKALARWISPEEKIVWEDEALMVGGTVEKHVLAIDADRETVRLLRSWVPYSHVDEVLARATAENVTLDDQKAANVSVDLDKTFGQIACDPEEIDEMSFPHSDNRLGQLGEYHEGIFLDEFGGDVQFLWKMDQLGRTAFLGRVARVGREEALFGASITHTAGNPKITVGFEIPLSEIAPTRRQAYR
jgi:hypothetical protein